MEIPDTWASLLVSALKDAVTYNKQLLTSETQQSRADYEEHLAVLTEPALPSCTMLHADAVAQLGVWYAELFCCCSSYPSASCPFRK